MRELVGQCSVCGKDIFCADGFLEGVIREDKQLECLTCSEGRSETGLRLETDTF
ncbi:hypothetical protein ACFPES_13530 [Paenibacillus sp. GCM10023248]|uniref:hypothetical protein n=1 Tax=Bacillales TaxID=1385 RepID=UPI00237997BF|nr:MULTISPECIES: hypothetical protein [Bacillales]MDD9268054.1 hypothetical protein [Paenibacillus sp. MAHUQ-63]MDR6879727.1 hypothetical protein [Bacillus sp. 3255]